MSQENVEVVGAALKRCADGLDAFAEFWTATSTTGR